MIGYRLRLVLVGEGGILASVPRFLELLRLLAKLLVPRVLCVLRALGGDAGPRAGRGADHLGELQHRRQPQRLKSVIGIYIYICVCACVCYARMHRGCEGARNRSW